MIFDIGGFLCEFLAIYYYPDSFHEANPDPPKLIGSDRIPIVNPAFNKPYKVSTNLMSLRCVGAAGVHADQLLGEREPLPVGGQLHHRDLGLRQSVRFNRNLKNTN